MPNIGIRLNDCDVVLEENRASLHFCSEYWYTLCSEVLGTHVFFNILVTEKPKEPRVEIILQNIAIH